MRRGFMITALLLLTLITTTKFVVAQYESNAMKFRYGNVSMIEVGVTLTFTVSNSNDYQFYIPNSWFLDPSLISYDNKLYKIEYIPISPLFPDPSQNRTMEINFVYDIYVAPPENSAPYDFSSRAVINSQYVQEMPKAMKEIANVLFSNAETYYEVIYRATDFTSDYMTYDSSYISREATVAQLWENPRGVCRHYAKFEIALLNYAGINTLFASGFLIYVSGNQKHVVPHAWLLAFDPFNGWIPVDPTNHNFERKNDFVTGVVYPFDLLVRASSDYVTSLDYPVSGDVSLTDIRTSFTVNYIKPIKYLNVTLVRTPDGFGFIKTEGAGLLIYHPLSDAFFNDSVIPYWKELAELGQNSIAEYVPAGYYVPIGYEPYYSSVLLNYYAYDVKPREVVDKNAKIYYSNGRLVFSGFDSPIYMTDFNDRMIVPVNVSGEYIVTPDQNAFALIGNKVYVSIFGLKYYLPASTLNFQRVSFKRVATYYDDGLKFVVMNITTTPDSGGEFIQYINSNYALYKVISKNILVFAGKDANFTLSIGNFTYSVNVYDDSDLIVKPVKVDVFIDSDYTTFNITLKNAQLLRELGIERLTSVEINGEKVDAYGYAIMNNTLTFKIRTTKNLLTLNNITILSVGAYRTNSSLLSPRITVNGEAVRYVDNSVVKLLVNATVTTSCRITPDAIMLYFGDSVENVEADSSLMNFNVTVTKTYPAEMLSGTFDTIIPIMGKDVTVTFILDNYPSLRASSVKLADYSASNGILSMTFGETFTSSSGVADTPTLILLKIEKSPYAIINGHRVKYSDYYFDGKSLTFTVMVPISYIVNASKLVVDGVPLRTKYKVETRMEYYDAGLVIDGIAPLGGLTCNVPYEVETIPDGNKDKIFIKVRVSSVYQTITCNFDGNTYVIKPQTDGLFSMNLADRTNIKDVASNGRVFEGYDGVIVTIITTQRPKLGSYTVTLDNETVLVTNSTNLVFELKPGLGVGEHHVDVYDGSVLVYQNEIYVIPQPLILKLLHNWIYFVATAIIVVSLIVSGVITTEPGTVRYAQDMFPFARYMRRVKQGDYERVYLYDPRTGYVIIVLFYKGRYVSHTAMPMA